METPMSVVSFIEDVDLTTFQAAHLTERVLEGEQDAPNPLEDLLRDCYEPGHTSLKPSDFVLIEVTSHTVLMVAPNLTNLMKAVNALCRGVSKAEDICWAQHGDSYSFSQKRISPNANRQLASFSYRIDRGRNLTAA